MTYLSSLRATALPTQGNVQAKPFQLPKFGNNATREYDADVFKASRTDYGTYDYPVFPRHPDQHVQYVVKHFSSKGDAVLELGCHTGNNLISLAIEGRQAFGIDISEKPLEKLKDQVNACKLEDRVTVARYDFAESGDMPPEWGSKEGKFKAIYAVHTLSHLSPEKLIETMQAMQTYLAPGGIILASIIKPKEGSRFDTMPDIRANGYGGNIHSDSVLEEAFKGLEPVTEFSRAFSETKGDVLKWALPADQIEWRVYKKPE